jgi:flagellum-specific peptidoglycan hydrolase FlgJ
LFRTYQDHNLLHLSVNPFYFSSLLLLSLCSVSWGASQLPVSRTESVSKVLQAFERRCKGVTADSGVRKSVAQVWATTRNEDERIFLARLLPEAMTLMKQEAVPVSACVAMAIYESNYGRSGLAQNHHNLFGIKAFRDWKGERARNLRTVDEGIATMADFRRYKTIAESTENYGKFLKEKPRYQGAFKQSDGLAFVQEVLRGGYCPDKDYLDQIKRIVARHQLLDLDQALAKNQPADAFADYWQIINGG